MTSMTAHPDARALADYLAVRGPRLGELSRIETPFLAQPGTAAVVYVETGLDLVHDVQVWLDPQLPADRTAVALAGAHQALHEPSSGAWDCSGDRDQTTMWLLWVEVLGSDLTADDARLGADRG